MLKPLNNFILVTVEKVEKKTASGIYLADSIEIDMTLRGKVISAGKDVEEVKEGSTVIFPRECGVNVKFEDKSYVVLNEKNVLAIVE